MKARIIVHSVVLAFLLCLNSIAHGATITFDEDSLLGSYSVGDTISSDGFDILVGGDPSTRTSTRVQATNIAGGTGNELQSFADRELIFQLTESYASASFKFKNSGGTNFININGVSTPLVGGFGQLAGMSYGGVDFSATGGSLGTLTLTGEINSLTISGQELAIDDVNFNNAPPEPVPGVIYESHILGPTTPTSYARFGNAVAIDGTTALVGSPSYSDARIGAVYSYDAVTGNRLAEFNNDGVEESDYFGSSLAIDRNIAIVGAMGDDDLYSNSGAAYLFDPTTGQQLRKLTPPTSFNGTGFGTAVGVSGARAVVGASRTAFVFNVETGDQPQEFDAPSYVTRDFGSSIAIDGTNVIIGDPHRQSTCAYVFDADSGQLIQRLVPNPGERDQLVPYFGDAVTIQGDLAIVGATGETIDGVYGAGAAYLFKISTGERLAKYVAPTPLYLGAFGGAVDLDGDRAIIGFNYTDNSSLDQQRTFIFDITTGEQLHELVSSNQQVDDHFGYSVGISGNHAVVGAYSHTLDGNPNLHHSGTAYLFAVPEPSTASLLILCLALGSMAQRPHHQGD